MRVSNMTSSKGNTVANQFVVDGATIELNDELLTGTMFQSYNSNIVFISGGTVYLDEYYWDYSRTTGKYRNRFLGENVAETRKRIASGEYKLVNLNR